MNNYILLVYFLYIIISYLLNILFNICKIIILKGLQKGRFISIFALVDFFHYILYIIKYIFTEKIMVSQEGLFQKWDNKNYSILTRSHNFDGILILFLSFMIFFYLFFQCHFWIHHEEYNDIKINSIIELNGIKIKEFELTSNFDSLDEKSKNELIFKKNNIGIYKCELNENQINKINEINAIRKKNNISELKIYKYEKIPYFVINPKLQLIFHQNDKIYKISRNSYIFKYNKNEFQNLLNNMEIINIIKIDYLDEIKIIEQNDTEFIFIYNNRPKHYYRRQENNNINNPHIDMINNEDKFVNLSFNEISDRDISEKRNINKKK